MSEHEKAAAAAGMKYWRRIWLWKIREYVKAAKLQFPADVHPRERFGNKWMRHGPMAGR
jgi:hypothetical protein